MSPVNINLNNPNVQNNKIQPYMPGYQNTGFRNQIYVHGADFKKEAVKDSFSKNNKVTVPFKADVDNEFTKFISKPQASYNNKNLPVNTADTLDLSTLKEKKKSNAGKIALGITAAVAATAGIIYAVKTGKIGKSKKLLEDIKFDKGIAKLKDGGENFTGVIKDTLKNGDKITLEYKDGIIKKSTREGSKTFTKVFETLENDTHKIIKTENGKTTEIIREELQNAAKESKAKLDKLMTNKDSLSAEEFQKQADKITHKSKQQKEEITKIVNNKKMLEEQAKAEAEHLTNEVKAKATEVEAAKTSVRIIEDKYNQDAEKLIEQIDEKGMQEISEFINNCETVEFDGEIIRHATTAENAETIRTQGYNIFHDTRNNGSNNFKGMDVEVPGIKDFGNRYGDTKLEYEYTGKALKLTNEMSSELSDKLLMAKMKNGKNVGTKIAYLDDGEIQNAVLRKLIRNAGYDAIAVAPEGETLFITILDPNNTKGLKYIRTLLS